MKILLSAAVTAVAVAALAGCGDDTPTAEDPERTPPSSTDSTDGGDAGDSGDAPTVGSYPELEATDYTFVLEQICYCPIRGPVKVTVEDGEVTSAVFAKGGHGVEKGGEAPDYLRLTINDVIAEANDTEADQVDVTWPEGQDWPSSVAVDQVELATDDEVTYVIRNVQVS